ncbi:MAG: LysM peptidoglycan-binding domain-containing protein [Chloroflexi bacterium]|nr:MAG: LysM peptidoglycan-binding domain-containing protein [Chloroflexota bacterium]
MKRFKEFFNAHVWRIAVTLGLLVTAAVVWSLWFGTSAPPAEVEFAVEAASPTPGPTPRPVEDSTPAAGLVPTRTATPVPPTQTPTPIPVFYQVQPGDAPLKIAAAFNIPVDDLLDANNITDPTRLQIGQKLIIPVTVTPSPTAPTPTPQPTGTPSPTPEPVVVTVKSGDTLSGIAAEHNVSVDLLRAANSLPVTHTLRAGQELIIPPAQVKFGTAAVVHTVAGGDTLTYLSFLYGSTVEDIVAANPGLNPNLLRVGQQVVIPVTSPPDNPEANPALPQITNPQAMPAGLTSLVTQTVAAVNAEREQRGLPPLALDPEISQMALAHAQDMVARGYFAHQTPEGVDLRARFDQHQITANWVGENIQRNTKPITETATEAVRWFMNSAPHRANILHERFEQIGVGVAEGPPGWYTFVLDFAQRDGENGENGEKEQETGITE